uniref:Uncharacterized protein n=1 Tax=viral metagenome TaxID=1070528 RepID=A0A6M3JL38_9ZZZZ
MAKILWDRENDLPATNWDGDLPTIYDDVVYVKGLGCNCDPTSGNMCGGCIEVFNEYPIGENERYFWKPDNPVLEEK